MSAPQMAARRSDVWRPVRVGLILGCSAHLLGDAYAAMRDGLAFVWWSDLVTLALVLIMARELKHERGYF